MLSFERQQQILDILKEHKCVRVDFLCKKLYASGATIRRDLSEMDEKGLITRVRGGAALIEGTNQDAPLLVRSNENRDKKEYIAQLALRYVHDSATIFMDSSSTVTFLADKLAGFRDLSIVTNGIATMNSLNEYTTAKVFSSGGLIRNNSSFVGQIAIDSIQNFRADIFFFSCCGLSFEGGCTEADEDNAALKKQMWKNAKKRILLCDSTKVNQDYFCKVCDIQDIDLILMDPNPAHSFMKELTHTGILVNK